MGFTFLPEWDLRCWEKTLREYLKFEFDKVVFSTTGTPWNSGWRAAARRTSRRKS